MNLLSRQLTPLGGLVVARFLDDVDRRGPVLAVDDANRLEFAVDARDGGKRPLLRVPGDLTEDQEHRILQGGVLEDGLPVTLETGVFDEFRGISSSSSSSVPHCGPPGPLLGPGPSSSSSGASSYTRFSVTLAFSCAVGVYLLISSSSGNGADDERVVTTGDAHVVDFWGGRHPRRSRTCLPVAVRASSGVCIRGWSWL